MMLPKTILQCQKLLNACPTAIGEAAGDYEQVDVGVRSRCTTRDRTEDRERNLGVAIKRGNPGADLVDSLPLRGAIHAWIVKKATGSVTWRQARNG